MLVKNEKFLLELAKQFENSKTKGTVQITYKRYAYEPKKSKKSTSMDVEESEDTEFPCLVRSILGNNKISTLVEPRDTEKFQEGCGNIMRLHMDSLKKKEKVKKGAAAAVEKKKKKGGKGKKSAGVKKQVVGEQKLRAIKKTA
ncbi:signal recognition particle, SRP9/SRP14 subunit [Chytridium lagenaria]|nr:signal recognition particle, SRP9/SRP14 subunit [Chytridium lagenaria]